MLSLYAEYGKPLSSSSKDNNLTVANMQSSFACQINNKTSLFLTVNYKSVFSIAEYIVATYTNGTSTFSYKRKTDFTQTNQGVYTITANSIAVVLAFNATREIRVFDYQGLVQFGVITGTKPLMQLLDSNSALIWYAVNNTVNAQLVYLSKGSFVFNKTIQY